MKQLYLIGILVAVMLLVLTGLSKLGARDAPTKNAVDARVSSPSDIVAADQVDQANQEQRAPTSTITTTTTTMNTASTTSEESRSTTPIVLHTSLGDITLELATKDMPITAGNFIKLARSDFYDNTKFHRVIAGFMIQGGDPLTKDDAQAARWGTGGPGYAIPDEFGPRFSNARGTISMANAGPNTGGSQFFINTVDNVFLDGKHPVFGKVVSGMDVVDAIAKTQTGPRDVPVTPVVVRDVEVR